MTAGDDMAALLPRVADQLLDLFDGLHIDQRPLLHAIVEAGAHLERTRGGGELFDEGVIDARLREETIGAHAGLAGIAVFGCDRALHGAVQIGIVEDDEGRVAAELHRDLLHRR